MLGTIYDRQKQPEKAIDAWMEAVRLDPEDGGTCQNLGYLFLEQKDYEKALYWLTEAVRRNPGQAVAHYYRGDLLDANGERAAARDAWEKALAADPEGYVGRWARRALEENPLPMAETQS